MLEIIPNWHPILVHFTVSLFLVSTCLFAWVYAFPQSVFAKEFIATAKWNLYLACLITWGTLATGWYAYQTVEHDGVSHVVMNQHRNWAVATSVIFFLLALWHVVFLRKMKVKGYFVAGVVCACAMLGVVAHKGGDLVYRYGLGVMALPAKGPHHHADDREHLAPEPIHGAAGAAAAGAAVKP